MNLLQEFKNYLFSQEVKPSKVTVKNYLSDINHFIRWFENSFQKPFSPTKVTKHVIENYKIESSQGFSASSVERHLSSLRKFFNFLVLENITTIDPFKPLVDLEVKDPWHIKDFKSYLYVFNASHLTIKNYLIDIKQFLNWAEEVTGANKSLDSKTANILNHIDANLVEEYKQRLLSLGTFSPATINRKLSSLRKYVVWAQTEGLVNPIELVTNIEDNIKTQISLPQVEEAKVPEAGVNLPQDYSNFPPYRLFQKITKGINLAVDATLITQIVTLIEKIEHLAWKTKGQPVFSKGKIIRIPGFFSHEDLLGIKNIKKELYAPLEISTKNFPLYKKILFTLKYQRPNWYRTYHSYAIVHYFHFAILVIFVAGLAFGFYNGFVQGGSKNPTLAALPTNPPRILSFQGRLTDNNDNPITSGTNLRFAIYRDSLASGSSLLWQEVDRVNPDTDGIFNAILGNITSIPQSLFSENNALWLGVTVETTPELTPRQQLATVAFAANSETLQGLLPITATAAGTTNVVLALNSSGNLVIGGSATPTFQSTGGQFTLTGQTLLLTTNAGTNGNVTISPDGLGKIDLSKPIVNNTLNNNISTARGSVEVDDLFSILATSSGQSAFTLNQDGAGPLISASASGLARFTVDNAGNIFGAGSLQINGGNITSNNAAITIDSGSANSVSLGASDAFNISGNFSQTGTTTFSTGTGLVSINGNINTSLIPNSTSVNLGSSANYWGSVYANNIYPSTTSTVQGFLQRNNGALSPTYITDDFLFGGLATSSALFRITGGNKFSGTSVVASISANTTFAALVSNNDGVGDLFTASKSGRSIFTVRNNGQLTLGAPYYTAGCTALETNSAGTLVCGVDDTGGGVNWWNQLSGVLSPVDTGYDFALGGNSTSSARFSYTGIKSGQGIASISGQLIIMPFNGYGGNATFSGKLTLGAFSDPTIQTTRSQGLTIGGNTTGQIIFSPNNTQTLVMSPNRLSLTGASTVDSTGALSLNTVSNQTITTGTGLVTTGGDIQINGNDIQDSAAAARITFSTNTITLGSTTTLTASGLTTFTTSATLGMTSTTTLNLGNSATINSNATALNLQADGTPDVNIAGGSGATGCTILNASGNLTCSGTIVGNGIALLQNYWVQSLGALFPTNSTLDLLVGSQSTSSADFAITGIARPDSQVRATLSGELVVMANNGFGGNATISGALTLGAFSDPTIQTTKNQLLTIGGNTTGNLALTPNNGTGGFVDINGIVEINGTSGIGLNFTNTGLATDLNLQESETIDNNINNTVNLGFGAAGGILSLTSTTNSVINASARLDLQADGAIDVNIAGGSGATGCTITNSNGNLTCSGTIVGNGVALLQNYWTQNLGALFPTNSTLDFLFGSQATVSSRFRIVANNMGAGTLTVASISGRTSFATLVVNNDGVGDLITASASGWTRFKIGNSGSITSSAYTTGGGIIYATSNGLFSQTTAGSSNECLKSSGGGTPTWGTCGSGGDSFWGQTNGLLYPANSTVDLAIGGTSSTSAKFLFANVNSGTPTLKIFDSTKTFSLNLSHDGTNGNILSTTGTVNIGQGGGTLYIQTDIQNDSTNNLGAIQITDRLNILPATTSNIDSNAALIVNNPGTGDILSASAGGTQRFTLTNAGGIRLGTSEGFLNNCLLSGGVGVAASWNTCPQDVIDTFWNQTLGALYPNNSTVDLLVGGQSTSSADFAITGIARPDSQVRATLSGELVVIANNGFGGNATLSGKLTLGAFSDPTIQTTRNQGLTIGGGTTGLVEIKALNKTVFATPGFNNTLIGMEAGFSNTASSSTFIGFKAGYTNSSGAQNTFLGNQAGFTNSTTLRNTYVGNQAGYSSIGNDNTFIGNNAGFKVTSGGSNVAVGGYSMQGLTAGLTGSSNASFGYSSGTSISGTAANNTLIGAWAGSGSTFTGSNNTFLGYEAGLNTSTGIDNTFVGYDAGQTNQTGRYNIRLGMGSDGTSALDSSIVIGYFGSATANNQLVIGSNQINGEIYDAYLGQGVTDAAPTGITLNATGGTGTNITGGGLTLAGGKGTGNAAGGDIIFQTSDQLGTGSTLQSLTTKMIINEFGKVGIGLANVNPLATLDIRGQTSLGSNGGTIPVASISGTTAFPTLLIDNNGVGDIFAASKSGAPKVVINNQGRVGIGTTLPLAKLDIKNENSTAVQGSEKITNSNDNTFTTDTGNWTDPGGWTIVGGKANKDTAGTGALTLSNSALDSAPVAGTIYRIEFDYTTSSTSSGSISVSFGGGSSGAIAEVPGNSGTTVTVVVTASNTNALTITPTSDWIGTIDNVFVYPLTPNTAALRIEASNGTSIPVEIRPGRSGNSNIFVGYQSGYVNTNGSSNNAFGAGALASNIEGSNNNAFGVNALNGTTTGWGNSSFGDYAMRSNTVGILNAAFGYEALWNSVDGNYNSAFGQQALGNNDGGDGNTALGYNSLLNTDGDYNSSLGYQAGDTNILGSKNTFLGYFSDSNVGHLYNASAIGANSYVTQNDSLILGSINGINSATASARIGIGTTAPYVTFDVRGGSGTLAVGSFSGTTSFAALVTNNDGVGDLFTASKSGLPIFTVRNNGQLTLGAPYYTAGCTALETNSAGTVACGTDDGGANWWNQLGGVLSPVDTGYDFALGGNSTSSAKFSFTGIKTGQTIASISGQLVIAPNNGYGGNIIPAIDNKQSIGSSPSARWKDLFLGPASLHIQCKTTDAGCPTTQNVDYSLGINSAGTFGIGANLNSSLTPAFNITQGGNVGIGSTTPTANLHVSATDFSTGILLENTSSTTNRYPTLSINNYIGATAGHSFLGMATYRGTKASPTISSAGDTVGGIGFYAYNGTSSLDIARIMAYTDPGFGGGDQEGRLSFFTGDGITYSERMRIDHLGNVGIGTGTASPSALLHLQRGSDVLIKLSKSGTYDRHIDIATDNSLRIARTGVADDLTIDTSGRVGIGTTTPISVLQVNGGTVHAGNAALIVNQTGSSSNDIITASASGTTKFRVANSGSIYGASLVDIDNTAYFLDPAATGNSLIVNGSVGIGTTGSTAKLEVVSPTTTYNGEIGAIKIALDTSTAKRLYMGWDNAVNTNGAGYIQSVESGVAYRALLLNPSGGNVGIITTAPGAILHIGAAGTITNPTLRGFYGSIANSRDEWLRINDDDAGTPDYHTSGIYLDGPYIGTQSCIEVGMGDGTCNFAGGVNTVGGLGVDNLTVIDAAGQFLYSNLSGAIDKFGKINASGFGIDSNNNATYDLLVYDGGDIYTNRGLFGYGGIANITTYDTNENLSIDPNGTGSVDITGALNVTGGVTLGTSLNSTSDHFSLHDAKTDDTTYEWIGFYSGATRQGIILYDGAWTGCMNTATDFCLVAENSNRLVLQSGTTEVYVNDALTVASTLTGALNCTGCIDQTDVAASAIGQGELKTSTGVATAASGTGVDITGQVYQFTPSWTDTSTREHCVSSWTSNADPGNQTSRWRAASTDCTGVASNGTHTSRWRYITASDHPTLWMVANADGTLTQSGWEAEDPTDPTKWPENPNPIEGTDLKSGQYFVSPEFLSVTEMKKLYAQLPKTDQDEILKGLKDYIVNQRNWLTELNSLDDLENINERYYHSGRQWAFRYLSSHYNLAVPISISLFTKLVDGKLIAVDNAPVALQAYQDAQIALQQEEAAIPANAKKADIAEWYKSDGTNLEQGDVLEIGDHGLIGKAIKEQSKKIMGIVSSYPGQLLGMPTSETDIKVALSGRVPTKVSSENGPIKAGDPLTISSVPGVAAKATVAGDVIGKALEDYDSSDPKAVGKILVFVNVSWYDPDVYLANIDNFSIDLATTSAELNVPSYYTISDVLGTPTKRVGGFAQAAIGNLRVGGVSASEVLTNALNVTSENITINGNNIRDYISRIVNELINNSNPNLISPIASVDQVHTNLISPVSPTSKVAVKLEDDRVSILNGNSSNSATVTSFDNKGNATLSGSLAVGKDATVGGTLRAGRIIADQIEGLNIKASTVSANYITNNYYNSSSSSFPTLLATPSNVSSASSNLFSNLFSSNNFINIATYSSELAYVENLNGANAAFSQSLTVFGQTILSDTSIVGQLAVNGSLILSNNSINVLGTDLNLQPLRQGGLSIMAGLFYIDTNGNVTTEGDATVKGTLYTNAISPIPGSDLAINLGTTSALTNPTLKINNASGAAVLAINQKGDLVSSGSGTFGKLNIGGLIAPALAVSPTEVIATGSAGIGVINTGRTQMTINNKLVTEDSLIYITPTSTTTQTIFLLRQEPDKSFTVGIQNPSPTPIKFNWIIVN